MATLAQLTSEAVKAFVAKNGEVADRVTHIFPRCYVIARIEDMLMVARPLQDAEPHMRSDEDNGQVVITRFDKSLKAGDWCSVGYAANNSFGDNVAVNAVMNGE
jgi:hypothetical protein